MAGFVVRWVMKGSCPILGVHLLCGGGKACALGEQQVRIWSDARKEGSKKRVVSPIN